MKATPIRARDERVMPHAPGEIWAALMDFSRAPAWWPRSLHVKVAAATNGGVGSELEISPWGGRPFRCRVESIEPPRTMRMVYPGDFIVGTGEWRLDAVDGGTRVSYDLNVVAHGWLVACLARVLPLGRLHSGSMREVLENLERETARRKTSRP